MEPEEKYEFMLKLLKSAQTELDKLNLVDQEILDKLNKKKVQEEEELRRLEEEKDFEIQSVLE
jgi:hypothetical protein